MYLIEKYNLIVSDSGNCFVLGFCPLIDGYLAKLVEAAIVQVAGVQCLAVENDNFHRNLLEKRLFI